MHKNTMVQILWMSSKTVLQIVFRELIFTRMPTTPAKKPPAPPKEACIIKGWIDHGMLVRKGSGDFSPGFSNTNNGQRRKIPDTEAGCGPTGQICTHTDRLSSPNPLRTCKLVNSIENITDHIGGDGGGDWLSSPNPLRTYKSQIEKKTVELNATGEKLTILVVVVVVMVLMVVVVVMVVVRNWPVPVDHKVDVVALASKVGVHPAVVVRPVHEQHEFINNMSSRATWGQCLRCNSNVATSGSEEHSHDTCIGFLHQKKPAQHPLLLTPPVPIVISPSTVTSDVI